jgi:hypothetical protein
MRFWQSLCAIFGVVTLALMLTLPTPAGGDKGKEKSKEAEHKDKDKPKHKDKDKHEEKHKDKATKTEAGKTTHGTEKPIDWAHHEAQKKSNAQLLEAYHVLQRTKITLEKADHDYGGHRRDAVKSIGAAQDRLRNALAKYGVKVAPAGSGNVKGGNESQRVSDVKIAHALETLRKTAKVIHDANHDYFWQRHDALVDVDHAIRHLEAAQKHEKK